MYCLDFMCRVLRGHEKAHTMNRGEREVVSRVRTEWLEL